MKNIKEQKRVSRHKRVTKKVQGTIDRPRLCVRRSLTNFYAQIIDDSQRKILFGMSTMNKDIRSKSTNGGNVAAATALGEAMASEAVKKGIKKVCFDRGGYPYHGRVKAFAESARKGGMEF